MKGIDLKVAQRRGTPSPEVQLPSRRALLRAASVGIFALSGCGGTEQLASLSLTPSPPQPSPAPSPPQPSPAPSPPQPSPAPVPPPAPPAPQPVPPPAYSPPYALPGPGQAVAIGTNTAISVGSPELSPSFWYETLFNSYGGGIYHPDWSAAGAYVIAGTGGHAHGENTSAVLFDFFDATWKQIKARNPNARIGVGIDERETNGNPYYEISGSEECPAPPHPYAHLCPVPKAWVGNSRGGVIYVSRAAVANQARTSGACHWFNFDTQTWRRRTNDVFPGIGSGFAGVEGEGLIDLQRGRYYLLSNEAHYATRLYYLDASDWRIKQTESFPNPPSAIANGRMFIHAGDFLIRHTDYTGLRLFCLDLRNVAAGWRQLKVSGNLPSHTSGSAGDRWAHWRGKYYHLSRAGGPALSRLTPPADPLNGTWVVDQVILDRSLPPRGGTQAHYTALFEVPAIDCIAWVAGGSHPVYILRPE